MLIKCPNCGFSREVNDDKIPAKAQMATCPKCQQKFRFRETEPAFLLEEPILSDTSNSQDGKDLWAELDKLDKSEQQGSPRTKQPGPSSQKPSPIPWENLEHNGFFPGLFQTIKTVMFSPGEFFMSMPTKGGFCKPLIFYLLIAEVQALAQLFWEMAGVLPKMEGQAEAMLGFGMMGIGSILLLVFYPLLLTGLLFIGAGLNHLCLAIFRAASSGFEATFRAVCYASAPMILAIVPAIGPLIGLFWAMFCTFLSFKYAHRTTAVRVFLSMSLPLFIALLLASTLFIIKGLTVI